MPIEMPHPSKQSFIIFLVVSLVLHLAVCRVNVESAIPKKEIEQQQILQVSVLSVAAPSNPAPPPATKQKVEKTMRQEAVEKTPEKTAQKEKPLESVQPESMQAAFKQPEAPVQQYESEATPSIATSNDNGHQAVTVEPVLTESDYIQTALPQYPPRAVNLGMEGTVMIRALITNSGEARDVKISASSGFALLDNSALKAVAQWKFKPTAMNGIPHDMWVQVPVKFIIR